MYATIAISVAVALSFFDETAPAPGVKGAFLEFGKIIKDTILGFLWPVTLPLLGLILVYHDAQKVKEYLNPHMDFDKE